MPRLERTQAATKRAADVTGALVLSLLVAPVWILAWLAIRLSSPGDALQSIQYPGLGGRPFALRKFRTTRAGAGSHARPTGVGRLLERFRLDEMPQLLYVLGGQMSLVGPRPISSSDYDRLKEWQKRRYVVRPGVTGLWQITGRYDHDFDDMIRLDLFYIQFWSLFLDWEILLKTVPATVSGRVSVLAVPQIGDGQEPEPEAAGSRLS